MSIVEAQSDEHSNPLNVEEEVEKEEGEEKNEYGVVRSLFGDGSKTKYCASTADPSSSENTPPPTRTNKTKVIANMMATPKLK